MIDTEDKQGLRQRSVFFTVLIPSRNRASQLESAILSVLDQTYNAYEIIVLIDGSNGAQHEQYLLLEQKYLNRVLFVHHDCLSSPHGKSRVLNTGISIAKGDYICFLDDDDYWIYPDHLKKVNDAIILTNYQSDLFLSNQEQSNSSGHIRRDNWLACLNNKLARSAIEILPDIYNVNSSLLMAQIEFCSMNTLVAKKDLITAVGGLDNYLWYEEDHDFYLNLVDKAKYILFSKCYTAHCNVPDISSPNNLSTRGSILEKLLITNAIYNTRYILSERSEVKEYALRSKVGTTKKIAIELHKSQRIKEAIHYASEVLFIGYSLKWMCYLIMLVCIFLMDNLVNILRSKFVKEHGN